MVPADRPSALPDIRLYLLPMLPPGGGFKPAELPISDREGPKNIDHAPGSPGVNRASCSDSSRRPIEFEASFKGHLRAKMEHLATLRVGLSGALTAATDQNTRRRYASLDASRVQRCSSRKHNWAVTEFSFVYSTMGFMVTTFRLRLILNKSQPTRAPPTSFNKSPASKRNNHV